MAVTYTTRVKLATLEQRRRATQGLIDLLLHQEALDSWCLGYQVNAGGTISVTMAKALPKAQLAHLGLNDDGVVT